MSSEQVSNHVEQQQQQQQSCCCTRAELTELVRAIRFANPQYTPKEAHTEITQELSQHDGFDFLATTISLNDVKKVWKKAAQQQQQSHQSSTTNNTITTTTTTTSNLDTAAIAELLHQRQQNNDTIQLYTVGDGSVRTLAQEYQAQAAKHVVEMSTRNDEKGVNEGHSTNTANNTNDYVHVFCNVPADKSGSRPHQAIISFMDQKTTKLDSCSNIVKIQIAAAPDPTMKLPMLLYNAGRSVSTFIHPDEGYDVIFDKIRAEGVKGALGNLGGTKAYFYTFVTKQKTGPDVISIDTSQLAPVQSW